MVRLQAGGPTESARAIRKKLKYGNVHRQLRALAILDGLMQNAGSRFQKTFTDEALLERLRVLATDPVTDPEVKARCQTLFGQWAMAYRDTPGMSRVVSLYNELPQRKKPRPQQQSTALKESEPEPARESRRPSLRDQLSAGAGATSSRHKKDRWRGKPFNPDKEKPQLLQALASSSIASTNLMNALKRVNRETHRVSEDRDVIENFETCKTLRRQILRYIQHVESEEWLGGLIHANEELVSALMAFEVLDKSVEHDSDSDEDEAHARTAPERSPRTTENGAEMRDSFAGLMLAADDRGAKPPRPASSKPTIGPIASYSKGKERAAPIKEDTSSDEEDDDADDPFADRNAISTPGEEGA